MRKEQAASTDGKADKQKKVRRPQRGVLPRGGSRDRVVLPSQEEQKYGGPLLLDSQSDLAPEDIYEGLASDLTSPGWPSGGEKGVHFPKKSADIPLLLARDIHSFVRRAQSTNAPAYLVEPRSISRPTAIGLALRSLVDQLKASVPKDVGHHSEHVKLFLDAYVRFGLDGSAPDPSVINEYANGVTRDEFLLEGFLKYLRVKMGDRSNPFKPVRNEKTGFPEFIPQGRVVKDTFRRSQKARQQRTYHNYRASADLIRDVFRREPSVHVVRLDVGIMPAFWLNLTYGKNITAENSFKKLLQSLFRSINRETGPMRGVVGRIARLRWSPERGLYCHLVLFYSCSRKLKFLDIEKRIGSYWVDNVTKGVGAYSETFKDSNRYVARPAGKLGRLEKDKRIELLQSVKYLSSLDEYLGLGLPRKSDVFFLSELALLMPEKNNEPKKRGRPRKNF